MYIHFIVLGVLALFITIGLFYRASTVLFFLAFSYVFLLDQARYLNHFYLIMLISFVMIFVPAHRSFSIDAWRNKKIRTDRVPVWSLWFLRFHVAIPYFFGGIAKLNHDWLRGEPMRMWLANRTDYAVIGQYFTDERVVYMMTYGALLFDLFIIPLLIWKRTRIYAFAFAIVFNLMNVWLFNIGIFPWFMLAGTLLFFEPSWPRQIIDKIRHRKTAAISEPLKSKKLDTKQRFILISLAVYLTFQILVPLRHFLYPSDVHWSEEGHRFSWHMKLRSKVGNIKFIVRDAETGEEEKVDLDRYLTSLQQRKVKGRPDMILQFAHYLSDEYEKQGQDVEVYAEAKISLNGRERQDLISRVDLSKEPRTLSHADWILPLTTSL